METKPAAIGRGLWFCEGRRLIRKVGGGGVMWMLLLGGFVLILGVGLTVTGMRRRLDEEARGAGGELPHSATGDSSSGECSRSTLNSSMRRCAVSV